MKIGVVSDSHKNLVYLRKAIELIIEKGAEYIIHLGDDYQDAEILSEYPIKGLRVPGVFCPEYLDKSVKNRVIEEISAVKILITHTIFSHKNDQKEDLVPEDVIKNKEVDLVLFGHTHLYEIKKEEGVLCFNPGHLQEIMTKGRSATFGIVTIKNKEITCEVFDLSDNKLL
ncbi:MAG: YfcE family phosphodiesterase [bacterium]|nr:YfcE family phosphodiesterase [bacterium]